MGVPESFAPSGACSRSSGSLRESSRAGTGGAAAAAAAPRRGPRARQEGSGPGPSRGSTAAPQPSLRAAAPPLLAAAGACGARGPSPGLRPPPEPVTCRPRRPGLSTRRARRPRPRAELPSATPNHPGPKFEPQKQFPEGVDSRGLAG